MSQKFVLSKVDIYTGGRKQKTCITTSDSGGGFMEISILGKAILNIYRYLEPMADAIDRQIKTKTYEPEVSFGCNMNSLAKEIIALTERKIGLINIKVFVDKAVSKLNENNRKIIMLRFIDKVQPKEIATLLNISERTFFRRAKAAFDSFCRMIEIENVICNNILSKISSQKWFSNFITFFEDSDEDDKRKQLHVCDYLMRKVKQVS